MEYEAVAGCPRISWRWDTPQIKRPANGVVKGGVVCEIKISFGRNDSGNASNDARERYVQARLTLFAIFGARTKGGAIPTPRGGCGNPSNQPDAPDICWKRERYALYYSQAGRDIALPRFLIGVPGLGARSSSRCLGNIVIGLVALLRV